MTKLPFRRMVASSAFLALLAAGPASADPSDDPPSTLTLDRMDSASRIGIQVGFDKLDRVALSDGFVMRFNPYGQYVLPSRSGGFYAQLPIAHVFNSQGPDATGVGNLDVGAFVLPFNTSQLILRGGLALPTASESGNGLSANYISAYERLTDFVLIAPKFTLLRLSASTVQQSGMAFLRIDGGLDLAIDKPSGGNSVFVRGSIAGGVRADAVDLSLELANMGTLDGHGDVTQRFIHSLAFGFRTRGSGQFYGGMVFPLDEGIRGEVWIVTLGFQQTVN
jgi:hypothetical protein